MNTRRPLLDAARKLSDTVGALQFAPPVTHVYNPLDYAWNAHAEYLNRFGHGQKRVIFLGMNPGPFGMVQTGVPFGEVFAVREWLKIDEDVTGNSNSKIKISIPPTLIQNPKRPIEGFSCKRSEVSGRRLWGLFALKFGRPEDFFDQHFVANYCPLAFFSGGRNITPDKLPIPEQTQLITACDQHLREMVAILQPEWLIGVGGWAEGRARQALTDPHLKFGRILHPSPASPAANRGWSEAATRQLQALAIWPS